jgi:hypothetical protein
MTIREYYNIILEKLQKGDYKIGVNKKYPHPDKSEIKTNELPLHALNYIIYEYLNDNQDARWKLIFKYIVVPKGVNKEGCDIDFTKVTVDELVDFMITVK